MKLPYRSMAVLWLAALCGLCTACGETPDRHQFKKQKARSNAKAAAPTFEPLNDNTVAPVLTQFGSQNPENVVVIGTRLGNIKIRLYDDTPLHRANFLRLVKMKYFDGTEFYRVVKNFMIQGGGSEKPGKEIGRYTVPAEFRPGRWHVRGAVAMAREYKDNPQKRSASHDFYIVQGTKFSPAELEAFAVENQLNLSAEQRRIYTSRPGAPHLDNEHTVFGEVIEGMDVVDKIAALETDKGNWPLQSVPVSISVSK